MRRLLDPFRHVLGTCLGHFGTSSAQAVQHFLFFKDVYRCLPHCGGGSSSNFSLCISNNVLTYFSVVDSESIGSFKPKAISRQLVDRARLGLQA